MPFTRNPFEGVGATVNELDSRSHDQILHRTGNKHFGRIRLVRDSGSNEHRETPDIVSAATAKGSI